MAKKKLMHRGVKLACPVCGEREAVINLDLSVMDCTCESCGDSFSPETARKMIGEQLARWEAMCEWIDLAGEILTPVQRDCDALTVPATFVEVDNLVEFRPSPSERRDAGELIPARGGAL